MTTLEEMREVWDGNPQLAHHKGHKGHKHGFEAIGQKTIKRLREWYVPGEVCRVLEWGVGGGANAKALEDCHQGYVGVDISPESLAAAVKECPTVTPVLLDASPSVLDLDDIFDTVISTAVFQHFPDKQYGIDVVACMARHMAKGAHGLIQTRYYQPMEMYDPQLVQHQPYDTRFIGSNAYQIAEFWRILERAGLTAQDVSLEPLTQYAWYRFSK